MKIAVFLPNWIGDAVMATPTLRAVRENFPAAEIVAVARPYVADVLGGLNLTDRVLLHDPRGGDRQRRGWPIVQQLRREKFDLALLLPNSLRSGWMAWLSGAKRRVGFARDARSWLLTDPLQPRSKKIPHPALDEYLRLAAHLGCQQLSRQMELATLPKDEQQLDEFWSRHDPALTASGVICLNPGGAFGSAKHWPSASFGRLAARTADELGRTVLVLCGPAERTAAREIVRQANHSRVVSLADVSPNTVPPNTVPLSIGLTKAAIKRAELLVTTDSGPRHFAPPFGVPVVTLFGPTHIEWSETHAPRAIHVQLEVDCGPCQQRICPLGHHQCMRDLSVEQVFAAVKNLLVENVTSAA